MVSNINSHKTFDLRYYENLVTCESYWTGEDFYFKSGAGIKGIQTGNYEEHFTQCDNYMQSTHDTHIYCTTLCLYTIATL